MSGLGVLAATGLAFVLSACTTIAEVRTNHGPGEVVPLIDTEHPSVYCAAFGSTEPPYANSIEDYDAFWASYVELDDEGWQYRLPGQPTQLQVLHDRLERELGDPAYRDTDFLVVAFIHGWHHNAHDSDCNVHEFRAMLKVAAERYRAALGHPFKYPRRIVGVYIGWRGESLGVDGLNMTTVLDRRNAAERIAKGDVREVFALLRKLQVGEAQKPDARADRMRTVVIGHSFGGLIAFNGLSPAVLNELTLTKPELGAQGCRPTVYRRPSVLFQKGRLDTEVDKERGPPDRASPVFPDQLILINPAFEATRFESLHQLMRPGPPGCAYPEDRPKLVIVTADNDTATGAMFKAGRQLLTALQAYPLGDEPRYADNERDANTHAIGFVDRYLTHRLCLLEGPGGATRIVAAPTPPKTPDWTNDRFAPIWVVRAPPNIVNGHNGFFYARPEGPGKKQQPWLLDWLVNLHLYGPGEGSPAMTGESGCVAQ